MAKRVDASRRLASAAKVRGQSLSHRVERVAHQTPPHRAGTGGTYLNRVLGRPHRHLRGVGERGVSRADPCRFEWMITGHSGSLVGAAIALHGVRRAVVPVIGGLLAGLVCSIRRGADFCSTALGRLHGSRRRGRWHHCWPDRPPHSQRSLLTIASGGSIGREGPMVQLAALIGSKFRAGRGVGHGNRGVRDRRAHRPGYPLNGRHFVDFSPPTAGNVIRLRTGPSPRRCEDRDHSQSTPPGPAKIRRIS